MKKYTSSHEWIEIEEGTGTVGITKYARGEFGEIVYLQLPTANKKVSCGDEIAVLESTKAATDIYAPVSGEILEVNTVLANDLSLLNNDPEGKGWLFKIKFSNIKEELSMLYDLKEYESMIQG